MKLHEKSVYLIIGKSPDLGIFDRDVVTFLYIEKFRGKDKVVFFADQTPYSINELDSIHFEDCINKAKIEKAKYGLGISSIYQILLKNNLILYKRGIEIP